LKGLLSSFKELSSENKLKSESRKGRGAGAVGVYTADGKSFF
jgi:hypothetical protein